jgi:hypothetical protein
MLVKVKLINCGEKQSYVRVAFFQLRGQDYGTGLLVAIDNPERSLRLLQFAAMAARCEIEAAVLVMVYDLLLLLFFIIWFVRLLALRPLLAYCASFG